MSLKTLLNRWEKDPDIASNISTWRVLPARLPQLATIPPDLPVNLSHALNQSGIQALFSHQARALSIAREVANPVVVTGTASGKSLCYNLPVLERLLRDQQARAIYLFPTKALSQDQFASLAGLLDKTGASHEIPVATYDGDTPVHHRSKIRGRARLIITNPDMLHLSVLPHHTSWAETFRHLAFVVIDEMHAYRGVFGSHVANVMRRLKRIAHFYGSAPQYILTSATLANPVELAERLIEEPVVLIDEDGASRGNRNFMIYNPPIVNPDLGLRRSARSEAVRLAQDLLANDIQTVLFGGSRRSVELALADLRQVELRDAGQVRGYRSGYLPRLRREIESGLRDGRVRAVVATNALELGVDIGGMGAALMAGYPGTIAATWQQAGRAGRKEGESLSILVASARPLDQFLAHQPDYFFSQSPEHALINPDNLLLLLEHIRCAAFELPFRKGDGFGSAPLEQVEEFLTFLAEAGELHSAKDRTFWVADHYPAESVSLRSASTARVLLQTEVEGSRHTLGEVDRESAPWMVHPSAVYLHEGETYFVETLDLDLLTAELQPITLDYYTQPRSETSVGLIQRVEQAPVGGGTKTLGEIVVTSQVTGFHRVHWETGERLDTHELDLPPSELLTSGYWLAVSPETVDRLREGGLWTVDPIDYGPNWRRQRDLARARDGHRCQACGALESRRSHHVHHKIPFRAFPSYEAANRLENLVTLCPGCHRQAEAVVRMRSGLAGLAYTLWQLAPLFLMCDTRDLGVHTDPQSPLADGSPAILLYDRVPAGIGFSQRLFELHDEIIARAEHLVSTCECTHGCPSCVGPPGESGFGGKQETLALLAELR